MNTIEYTINAAQLATDTQAVMDQLLLGIPLDAEIARRIRERGAQISREVYEQHGVLDIGVPAIRELRDGENL